MSTAEIETWLYGQSLARDHHRSCTPVTTVTLDVPAEHPEAVQEALARLGPHLWVYWLVRGAQNALGLPETGL